MLKDLESLFPGIDRLIKAMSLCVYVLCVCSVLDTPLTFFCSSFPPQTPEQEQAPGPSRIAFPEHTKAHQTVSSIHVYSLPCVSPGFGIMDTVVVAVYGTRAVWSFKAESAISLLLSEPGGFIDQQRPAMCGDGFSFSLARREEGLPLGLNLLRGISPRGVHQKLPVCVLNIKSGLKSLPC